MNIEFLKAHQGINQRKNSTSACSIRSQDSKKNLFQLFETFNGSL